MKLIEIETDDGRKRIMINPDNICSIGFNKALGKTWYAIHMCNGQTFSINLENFEKLKRDIIFE